VRGASSCGPGGHGSSAGASPHAQRGSRGRGGCWECSEALGRVAIPACLACPWSLALPVWTELHQTAPWLKTRGNQGDGAETGTRARKVEVHQMLSCKMPHSCQAEILPLTSLLLFGRLQWHS